MKQDIAETEAIENGTGIETMAGPTPEGGLRLMRAKEDDFTVWQSVQRHKRVGAIAMAAAFCASLDGYRKVSSILLLEESAADREHA